MKLKWERDEDGDLFAKIGDLEIMIVNFCDGEVMNVCLDFSVPRRNTGTIIGSFGEYKSERSAKRAVEALIESIIESQGD